MSVQVNFWAVIAATASALIVGMIWYAPAIFGRAWTKTTRIGENEMKKGMSKAMPQIIIAAFLTAYVMAHVTYLSQQFFGGSYFNSAISTAFWLWLGISATTILAHDAFERRPNNLAWINIGNRLATYLVMAVIIGAIGV